MIRVIGEDSKHIKNCTCRNCASVLEYTEADVIVKGGKDMTGCYDETKHIPCPKCGYNVFVR